MIVLAVLGVLGVLIVMIFNLSGDASFASQMMVRTQAQDRAYYVAASACTAGLELVRSQDKDLVTLQDSWAQPLPPLVVDSYAVTLTIIDEERFFNPNRMVGTGGVDDEARIEVFRRLLRGLEQREEIANALLDWMDGDANRRQPGGAEGLDYKDRRPKNAPLDSVEEIRWVQHATDELMSGRDARPRRIPGLTEILTVHSNGRVNVNTAHPTVLRALAPDLTESTVAGILERRLRKPFKSLDELLEVPGLTRDHLFYLQKVGAVTSESWRIEAVVTAVDDPDEVRVRVSGTYRKDRQGFRPVTWNVGETSGEKEPTTE